MFSSSAAQYRGYTHSAGAFRYRNGSARRRAPKPDISSVDAFKRALLNAKSIGYLPTGSGAYLAGLLDRLGIADAIKAKVTRPETDIVSEMVAKGELEIGMVVITQILTTPGVGFVWPLPPELQRSVNHIDIARLSNLRCNKCFSAGVRHLILWHPRRSGGSREAARVHHTSR